MRQILLYSLAYLTISACSPIMYTPTAYQVPMFEEKGEVAITAGYHNIAFNNSSIIGLDGNDISDGEGLNLQLATATGNNIAVTATLNFFRDVYRNETSSDYWKSTGTFMEAGVGKYGFIGDSRLFKYELYGGLGYGRSHNRQDATRISSAFLKPYIQPNIGITGKHVEFAVSTRLAMVSFMDPDYHTNNPEYREQIKRFFDEKNSSLVFEPGFTLRGGLRDLKAQIQYSYSTFRYQNRTDEFFGYSDSYISIGLFWLISERYK